MVLSRDILLTFITKIIAYISIFANFLASIVLYYKLQILILSIIRALLGVLLLIGAHKRIQHFVLPWLIFTITNFVYEIIVFVSTTSTEQHLHPDWIAEELVALGSIYGYAWLIVLAFYRDLVKPQQEQHHELEEEAGQDTSPAAAAAALDRMKPVVICDVEV